jgi:diguanylate cyclase (GGDEF)-like protein
MPDGDHTGTAQALAAMLQRLSAAEPIDAVRKTVAHGAHVLSAYDTVTIREFADDGALEATLRQGRPLSFEAKSLEQHLRRIAVKTERTLTTLDEFNDEELDGLSASYRLHEGLCLVRPLIAFRNRPVGVVCFHYAGRTTLQDARFDALRKFCDAAAVALYNARIRKTLHDLAYTDPLTKLPNRRRLEMELARSRTEEASVVIIDFDGLREVNNTLDYERGDALISLVGAALQANLREGELAARLGGDEFVVLLPGASAHDARTRAEELGAALDALQVPGDIRPLYRGASVGSATAAPTQSIQAALLDATHEMHARKRRRKTDMAPHSTRDSVQ